jgi:hypothetical protein
MAEQRLSLTRDQFASFLSDFEQIKQFERLFASTNANVISIDDVNLSAGNAGVSANDALAQIIELSDTLNKEPIPANVSQIAVIETQLAALGITPPDFGGTVTSIAASGGATGLTFTGSPITTSGTLTLGGTLAVASGGTGQTSYTDGQLLIGNTTGNTLTKATLTAGTNVTITNGAGAITINATDAFVGTVTSVSGTGTVNGITLTGTVTSSGNLTLGGALSGVSLTTQVSGTLPVTNGGTGTATAFTTGSVVFAGASGVYSQDNANLFWDDTNNRLGIGTATPSSTLDIGSGNLRFSSTGQYIQGDFSNGTLGNRTAIQTTTASSNTVIPIVPSAAGFNAGILCETDPTFTSGSVGQFLVNAGVDVRINSTLRGTGSYLPLTFLVGGAERMRIDTSGNVGVGATANASAILDVQSTTKGFRLPNMTTTQKNAISSPAAGLMVFDTTLSKACVYSGAAWQTITSI